MIRNSVDHGVEMPEDRIKAGKPETGTVKLRAYHQAGNIVIEIIDDGKGLDREVLVRKAIEKGVINPDAQLTEQQAFNLIMAPGFSTAEKVTDISGRGVGMDVVKKNIDKLRGKVEIRSTKGVGTTFTIRLPLTLAVIDGMIIRIGSQKFVLPTLSIVQSLSPTPDQIKTVQGRNQILNLRGEIYPLINLGRIFNLPDAAQDATQGMVVIAQAEDQQVGLILDELLGQQQVVIKSLGDRFKRISGITGGAILGDGTIGLILEPAGLLEVYQRSSAA
jgi:two-component system, chemotaxis family, sensor kinase CheA